jgi:hypothetical protein
VNPTTTRRALAVVLLVAAALYGCGRLPTSPLVEPVPAPAPADVAAPAPPASDPELLGLVSQLPQVVSQLLPPPPIVTPVLESLTAALPLDGSVGGVIRVGRFTVEVPAGAFDGVGVVEIVVPDTTRLLCRLHIAPDDKNHFEVPVRLTVGLEGVEHPERMGILWWNPALREWEPVESYVDPDGKTVRADLEHFSEYSVQEVIRSKAGW